VFISRDPMFEKYPFMSPYAYCKNNPLIRIDPTGEEDEEVERGNNKWGKLLNAVLGNKAKNIEENYKNNSYNGNDQKGDPQKKPKPTLQQQLESTLANVKVGEDISGEDLANAIGLPIISSGVSKVTRKDKNTFDVTRTTVGKIGLNDSPLKITKTNITIGGENVSAYRIQIDYKKGPLLGGALPDFYLHDNNIYFYGENGKLYQGSFGK
jgi:hypothetical protein